MIVGLAWLVLDTTHCRSRAISRAKYLEVTDQHEPRHEPNCAAPGAA